MGAVDSTFLAWLVAGEHLDEAGRLAAAANDRRRSAADRRGSRSLGYAALNEAARITHDVAAAHPRMDARVRIRLEIVDSVASWLGRGDASGTRAP